MAIWDWALAIYERPGVPEATLALQDLHGQNTSYLLWAVHARTTDPDLLARAAATARTWEQTALGPLRSVRRALKPSQPPVPDAARAQLRDAVKRLELAAEKLLMETLDGLAQELGNASIFEALQAATLVWGAPAPDDALAGLATALE